MGLGGLSGVVLGRLGVLTTPLDTHTVLLLLSLPLNVS